MRPRFKHKARTEVTGFEVLVTLANMYIIFLFTTVQIYVLLNF